MLPSPREVRHLLSFPAHGLSSSCLSCLASPAPLWGWPLLGVGLCCLLGFLLLRDLLAFTMHLPMELLTCLFLGIMSSSWPLHHPSSGKWKIPFNMLLHGSCKGRNYYKMPEGEGGRTSPDSARWDLYSQGDLGASCFVASPASTRKPSLCHALDGGACSCRSREIIYAFPEAWQLGLGLTEEVQVLSEAGASYASATQCPWNCWGPRAHTWQS